MLSMHAHTDAATTTSTPRTSSPLNGTALRASFSRRASMSSADAAAIAAATTKKGVDPKILKKLSATVSQCHGPRKNLSYVVSVETLVPGARAFQEERESCLVVTRSFDDFMRFRKSLLTRVGSKFDPSVLFSVVSRGSSGKCHCKGRGQGCAFDASCSLLERMRFSRMSFLGLGTTTEADLDKRQLEMNNFLRIVFAVLHRMQPSAWKSECLFLRDVLAFLEVEETFFEQIEELLKLKSRQLGLQGWKAHSRDTFGSGIRM